ncbi:class I SAM-dependent methyltransferase [Actinoplanes sp. NBRC 103695]|uniref:SAM-dependent methyltransferase n=1 Tax=Actinoplanes sp. NBRC 103695 TaxID=3032202 RepID=UPI0024A0D10D|nr:class I SAM-dependent methyltransferase [Actinoplanes sp. NBRC 103695]GLZ01798.1 hypothetical protein Acsp02_90490 [Actinoplanes sp. NBRC 103695]
MHTADNNYAFSALAAVEGLRLDAEQAAVLRGGLQSGFLARCMHPVTVEDLAESTALDRSRVEHLCRALRAIDVLHEEFGHYRLAPFYAALVTGGADGYALDVLNGSAVRQQLFTDLFASAGSAAFWSLGHAEQRALAASVSVDPFTSHGRTVMTSLIEGNPAWHEAFSTGARYLEFGCGLSGAMLAAAAMYPALSGVGIDISADLINVARARAVALGLSDRIDFIVADAAVYTYPHPFDVVLWSQFFFSSASRPAVLANARAQLRPGGLLIAPVLIPAEQPETIRSALDTLLVRSWEVPPMTSAELEFEVAAAGFVDITVHRNRFGTMLLARRPSLVGRDERGSSVR